MQLTYQNMTSLNVLAVDDSGPGSKEIDVGPIVWDSLLGGDLGLYLDHVNVAMVEVPQSYCIEV